MTWKQVFTTSVGKKLTMGLTGISLVLFLIVHAGLNACIWANDDGAMFNRAAHFMGSNIIPRLLEVGLIVFFILHIFQGYALTLYNKSKRSVGYEVAYGNKGSKWYSRSMAILGSLLLIFLIMHFYHFWTPSRLGGMFGIHSLEEVEIDGKMKHNLFLEMKTVFQSPIIVALYVFACGSLGYHLAHGFQSAFKTLGVHNKRYQAMLSTIGYGYSIIIPLTFAMMPLSFYFGWI